MKAMFRRVLAFLLAAVLVAPASVRFDAAGEYLGRTANLTSYNAAYTVCFWVYISVDTDNYGHFWGMTSASTEASGDYTNSDFGGVDVNGTTSRSGSFADPGPASSVTTGSAFSTGTWYHVALRRNSSSSLDMLINGSVAMNTTLSVGSRAAVGGEWIGQLNGGYPLNGRIAYFKEWSAALSDAEIQAEDDCKNAARTSNLVKVTRLESDLVDEVNGYNWTGNGSYTFEADPPGVSTCSSGGGAPAFHRSLLNVGP